MRLQKYLADCGVASRRSAEQLIAVGRVAVNGRVVVEQGVKVDPRTDEVTLDGRPVKQTADKVYLVMNKPVGLLTTSRDPWGRPTVLEMAPRLGRLFPAGRLDADSEGLLLLTDDGELANRLMHPRYGCEKEYRALVDGTPDQQALERLRGGIQLSDGRTAPAHVEVAEAAGGGRQWIRVTLHEGRKRQVRRMLAAVGLSVKRLQRVRIGPLELGRLPVGQSRPLSGAEVAGLKAVGAPQER
jgi:23S rRNA pseudouridine2605 synthase